MNEINLCGRPNACCVKVKRVNDDYVITDDYDGEVLLTRAELERLQKIDIDSLVCEEVDDS